MSPNQPKPQQAGSLAEQLDAPWLGVRQDLVVVPGPRDDDGHQTWVVEDPVRGSTFRLGPTEGMLFAALARYADLDQALKFFYSMTSIRPAGKELLIFLQMLQRERLTNLPPQAAIQMDNSPMTGGPVPAQSWRKQLINSYIFFRVPLVHPDRFLERWWPWVQLLNSAPARVVYLILGVLGVLMTAPNIELYLATTSYLFTPEGGVLFVATLTVLKVCHELAHAFTAKAFGLHVRTIGVAFIVLWPIMYTDVTDAWKLDRYRKRLAIDTAGVAFELVIAGLALFLWALLPDGVLRSVMFFLSGISITTSLFVNLNPLMKFDGYYILMDLWRMDNLMPRAFALFRHKLRRLLFDWQGAPPERHPKERQMVVYAIAVMIYRLLLAIAIGLAVYHLFFKALGIVVFLVEIWVFVVRPVWSEVKVWWPSRALFGSRVRLAISAAALLGLIALLLIPITRAERFPGLVVWDATTPVVTTAPGFLVGELPSRGTSLRKGDLIAELDQPDLENALNKASYELRMTDATLANLSSGGEKGGYRNWLMVERQRQQAGLETLNGQLETGRIEAPVDGVVVDINADVGPGSVISPKSPLVVLAHPDKVRVRAYIHEKELSRIPEQGTIAAECRFNDLETDALPLLLLSRGRFPVGALPNEVLLDTMGGPIVAAPEQEAAVPRDAHYAFEFAAPNAPGYLRHGTPCWVWMNIENRSIASTMVRGAGRLLAEEGFL
ncbi:MAG: HlyD family efflux transporter periplasmic adaptor subunit [Gammaproteobacteria bacterium]|nr:HlyD family efflux transporter periplasmic adaptor subunit [Gammaproteobacteria bacterium]